MRLWFLALFLAACSSGLLSYRSPGPYEGGTLVGGGTYLVEFWLEGPNADPVRFNAVFARKKGDTLVSAVAPSGKPLFRARDFFDRVPELKVFPTEIAVKKELLESLYTAFRTLIVLDDKLPATPLVEERYPDGRPRRLAGGLSVDEYDWEGHAFRISLRGEGWSAKGTLRGYEIKR